VSKDGVVVYSHLDCSEECEKVAHRRNWEMKAGSMTYKDTNCMEQISWTRTFSVAALEISCVTGEIGGRAAVVRLRRDVEKKDSG
jgi:hypothetical protein